MFFTTIRPKSNAARMSNGAKGRNARPRTYRPFRPVLETLEDRTVLDITLTGTPNWLEQGPGPIVNSYLVNAQPNNAAVGAVESVAVQQTGIGHYIVYVGTVNGGVWKTTDITDGMFNGSVDPQNIHWTPLTDAQPSLATSAMALDPNDKSGNRLWVATGSLSSYGGVGGPSVGLLYTTDGGFTWTNLGTLLKGQVFSVVPTTLRTPSGQVVLVAGSSGLQRSNDGGSKFSPVTNAANGLPLNGVATDVVAVTNDPNTYFAALPGQGVFESTDGGVRWFPINNGLQGVSAASSWRCTWTRPTPSSTRAWWPTTRSPASTGRSSPRPANSRRGTVSAPRPCPAS
jgi:hypothetical protein